MARMIDVKDLDAVSALKADPYEPVETVEAVIFSVQSDIDNGTARSIVEYATRIRAAYRAELAAAAAGGA